MVFVRAVGYCQPRKQQAVQNRKPRPQSVVHSVRRLCAALPDGVRPCGNMPQMPCPVNSQRSNMQGMRLLLEEDRPAYLRQETDTAHPHTPIPIYYIHDFPTPFCTNPGCFCQRSKQDATRLFGNIARGSFFLLEAAALKDESRAAGMNSATRTDQARRTEISVDIIPGIPPDCQLYGHSWEQATEQGVKHCSLCGVRGYCSGCTPIPPVNALPFTCRAHGRGQV